MVNSSRRVYFARCIFRLQIFFVVKVEFTDRTAKQRIQFVPFYLLIVIDVCIIIVQSGVNLQAVRITSAG